jgi:hypothetical protein
MAFSTVDTAISVTEATGRVTLLTRSVLISYAFRARRKVIVRWAFTGFTDKETSVL